MKKLLYPFISCAAAVVLFSCETKESRQQTFQRIDTEVKQNSKAYSALQEATTSIGHRLTGSANGAKAEEYTFNKFKEYGFDDVQYQEFEVEAWSRGEILVEIDGRKVPAVTLGHSPVTADVSGDVVDMGNGLDADYKAKPGAVKDKLAFIYIGILEGSPKGSKNLHRSEKTKLAIDNGAKGVIIYNQHDSVLLTGTASVTGELLRIPAVCISQTTGSVIKETLKKKKVRAHIAMTNHSGLIKARNVVATLKGSELPDERVIIGGHLDSWDLATGAIDNGIGSFTVLDIARSFKANKLQPKRTVQFIMFMGEEQGLLGSTWMVKEEVKNGTIENIKYMMNLDMTSNPYGINAGGKIDDAEFFKGIASELQALDTAFKTEVTNRSGLHSDHQPFMLEGVPILGLNGNLSSAIIRCYHADCDHFGLVDPQHLTNTVRFGTMVLYGLANAETLPAKKMDSETTKQFMIDNNLEEPLKIAGDWKWN